MRDRITAGFLAGIAAGLTMNVIDWAGYLLGFYQEQLLDWAAVALYGRLPTNTYEIVFAQMGQIVFAGFLGIFFAYLLLKLTSCNYIIRGWVFSLIVWFGLYAISIAFQIPNLERHSFFAGFSHFLSASVYGLVLALVLNYIDKSKKLLC